MTDAVVFPSAALPGWFGKLPGMGDFAHRRLPESFRSEWDHWLQRGLARLKDRHEDWISHYLQAPVWCFALGPGVAGQGAWIGVMMPSVDGVGRYFPITLAVEFDASVGETLGGDALRGLLLWWERGTQAALEGLEGDMDALGFDALLERLFVATQGGVGREGGMELLALPGAGGSLWLGDPGSEEGARMVVVGLPLGGEFEALFVGEGE
ncbi:type VI secretion system-associated protein TagF [Variovorax paradoxus]|uniref:type VI secretion system-associated protein TagF n=1 Tax=Variovorax paradoxus TaxID=34073 RepID=UPI00248077C1|nr:type VI secretion system-associated protein TagF [Variovorax paradoxus]WGT61520.1 type VI secretion system-associated protein TagF [Variovorax paradoxus]